jgi:hypothetical protein
MTGNLNGEHRRILLPRQALRTLPTFFRPEPFPGCPKPKRARHHADVQAPALSSLAAFANLSAQRSSPCTSKKILVVPLPNVALLANPLAKMPGVDQRREHVRYGVHA